MSRHRPRPQTKFEKLIVDFPSLWDINHFGYNDRTVNRRCLADLLAACKTISSSPITLQDINRKLRSFRRKLQRKSVAHGTPPEAASLHQPLPDASIRVKPLWTDDSNQHHDTEEDQDNSNNSHPIASGSLPPERPSSENNTLEPVIVSKEDEYDLFGRYMASLLRKMPELAALHLMQKMQLMVLKTRTHLSKEKPITKEKTAMPAQTPSTSSTNTKRAVTPPMETSSSWSPPSPLECYKFEITSPNDTDTDSRGFDGTGGTFTYATTLDHAAAGGVPASGEVPEDLTNNLLIDIRRELKRNLPNSDDPLQVKINKIDHSQFPNE